MPKPLALSIAACLGLAGCQVFEKSETWEKATRIRPGDVSRDPDPSQAYAAKLHRAFAQDGIEHKVVVYQYRYTTRLREEAVGTRTAVIYRDPADGRFPWWLKDDRLNTPVWLPNGDLNKQVGFYLRRKAEVIEQKDYPGSGSSGKASLAFARPAPKLRSASQPQVAVVKAAPAEKAASSPALLTRFFTPARVNPPAAKPAPAPIVAQKPVVRKAAPPVVAARPAPKVTPKKVIARSAAPQSKPAAPAPKAAVKVAPKIEAKQEPKPVLIADARPAAAPAAAPSAPKFFAPTPVRASEADSAPSETTVASSKPEWSAPPLLDTSEEGRITAPRDSQLEKRFRAKHGTDYNRFSPTDRRKMQQLQNGVATRE